MNQIFRISGAGLLAGLSSLFLAPVSTVVQGQTTTATTYTCQASSFSVSPAPTSGNLSVSCTSTTTSGGGTAQCSVTPATQTISNGITTVTASNCGASPTWTISPPGTGVLASASSGNPLIANVTVPLPGSIAASYTVTATDPNNSTSTGTGSAFVNVPATTSSGGTGGGTACGTPVTLPWGGNTYASVPVAGSAMMAVVVPASLPVGTTGTVRTSTLSGGSFSVTYGPLSSTPCYFPTTTATITTSSGAVSYSFQIGGTSTNPAVQILQPGLTYFIGLKAKDKTVTGIVQFGG